MKRPEDIERELGVVLPAYYKQILENFPLAEEDGLDFRPMYGRIGDVITVNIEYRRDGWFGLSWPKHYVIVGEDGLGNVSFIDTTKPRTIVYKADHNENTSQTALDTLTPPIIVEYPALEYMVHEIVRDVAACEENERLEREWESACQERKRNKKWWQFWI
jgi:hypothetical protein